MSDLTGALTALVAVLTLPVGLLAGLFVGLEAAAIVFIVGWLLLVPGIPILGEELLPAITDRIPARRGPEADPDPAVDPVAELKRQYAEGEISEAEFERRVEQVLEADEHAGDAPARQTEAIRRDADREPERH